MTDNVDAASDSDDASALETCPACGNLTTMTVLVGPGEAYSSPCGCLVAPESVLETSSGPESPGSDLG